MGLTLNIERKSSMNSLLKVLVVMFLSIVSYANELGNILDSKESTLKNKYIQTNIKYEIFKGKVVLSVMSTNIYKDAKGAISISIPKFNDDTHIIKKDKLGFGSVKAYPYNSKLWSGKYKRTILSKYLNIEGWSNKWNYKESKKVQITINTEGMTQLLVNVRTALISNKKEFLLPNKGYMTDQQGYLVEQIVIDLFPEKIIKKDNRNNQLLKAIEKLEFKKIV